MQFQFDNQRPIYLQAAEQIRQEIISGRLKEGEKLPSVRDLAVQAQVNPNTIQKALGALETEGLICTKRTSGKFVSADPAVLAAARKAQARERTVCYVQEMQSLGLSLSEIRELLTLCASENGTSSM